MSAPVDFSHARERRSLKHRYTELQQEVAGRYTELQQEVAGVANAAQHNEMVTRERVVALEKWCGDLGSRGLWGRLKWLVLGR